MSSIHSTNGTGGRDSMGNKRNQDTAGRTSLLRCLIDTYLRVGFLAAIAFLGVSLVVELGRRERPGFSLGTYPQYPQYPEPPSPHPAGLNANEVTRLLNGQDGAYSRTAAFHGYPAPGDVLRFTEELLLSPEQVRQVESILARTQDAARGIGSEIVHLEAQLGAAFGERAIPRDYLHAQAERLGRLYGKLRAIHLESYVAVAGLLSPAQLERYNQLRAPEEVTIE